MLFLLKYGGRHLWSKSDLGRFKNHRVLIVSYLVGILMMSWRSEENFLGTGMPWNVISISAYRVDKLYSERFTLVLSFLNLLASQTWDVLEITQAWIDRRQKNWFHITDFIVVCVSCFSKRFKNHRVLYFLSCWNLYDKLEIRRELISICKQDL